MIRFGGLERLLLALRSLVDDRVPAQVEARVARMTVLFQRRVIQRTPVDTGKLRKGWRIELGGRGLKAKGRVYNEVPYVRYVEEGTAKTAPVGMFALTLADLQAGRLA